MNKDSKVSDVLDYWVEKGEDPQPIKQGDIVLLHNWGCSPFDQPIGVAELIWDTEYHGWDFKMIAGNYVDSQYDMWRQSPRVIGKIVNGRETIIDDELKHIEDWHSYLQLELSKANAKWERNQLLRKKKDLIGKKKAEEQSIEDLDKEIANLDDELKGVKK